MNTYTQTRPQGPNPQPSAGGADVHRLSATILGERYVIRGDAEPAYIAEVANMVDSRMRELHEATGGRMNKARLAVLAAINLADELLQERTREKESPEVIERTHQLITLLDEGLIGDTLD